MVDLVGTCPKSFWLEWIAEGDAAGAPESGEEWEWWTQHSQISRIKPGNRFYIVAHGLLRGYAPVTSVHLSPDGRGGAICRRGGAVACSIDDPIPGFRGLRERWWPRADELAFPEWKTANVA